MRESRASHVSRFDEGEARVKIEIPIIKEGDAAKGGPSLRPRGREPSFRRR